MRKLFVIALGCTVLLLVGYVGYLSYSKSKETKLMAMARNFVAHGQEREAGLSLSEVLHLDSRNVEANRMMADLAAEGSPAMELQWRSRVVQLNPHSPKDRIALAIAAIKVGDLVLATNSLAQIMPRDQATAEYQNAAGVVAIAEHQPMLAESAFAAATALDPSNAVPRLNLAVLRLHSTNQTSVAAARETLRSLALGPNPNYHCQALRELIADAFVHGEYNSALGLSRRLLAEPSAQFSDRLLELDVLQRLHAEQLPSALAAAQTAAGLDQSSILELAQWEVKNLSSDQALNWISRLPETMQTNQPVAMLAAECRIVRHDWAGLNASLSNQNWGGLDFVRHALRARAYYEQQILDSKSAEWDQARQTAGTSLKNLRVLLEFCTQWNWPVEKTDVLTSILNHHPEAKWAIPPLVNELATAGRTRALLNLFQQLSDRDPGDLQAKNNLALTSMLLNATEMRPFDLAVEVYQAQPTNVSFASTYAFSLYEQKNYPEALKVFAPFDAKALLDSGVAGYYGIILRANGHPKLANDYLQRAIRSPRLLPEERKLFTSNP